MNKSKIRIVVEGTYCNDWPRFKVTGNNYTYFDDYVVDNKAIEFEMPVGVHNKLIMEHYGKQFGENGQWDTRNENNVITQDRAVRFVSLSFDDVDVGQYLIRHWPFCTVDGQTIATDYFGFNGQCCVEFGTPVYDWIITDLVHDPTSHTVKAQDLIIETSHQDLFNYDQDLVTLKEIEQLLEQHAHLFNKSS